MGDSGQDRSGEEATAQAERPGADGLVTRSRRLDSAVNAAVITLVLGLVAAAIALWVRSEAQEATEAVHQPWVLRYMEVRTARVDDLTARVFRLERLLMEKKQ